MPADSLYSQHRPRTKKFKGLGRLRWYCTTCSKQCRDENGFNQHTQSESHVRKIDTIASNLGRMIETYSQQCLAAFLNLLRLTHGEKSIKANRFYQTYIADPHHVHLKDTRWGSLTSFVEWLGREGFCRFEKKDDGIYIAWINTSHEAERQAVALKAKRREVATDRRQEERQLEEQVKRAHAHAKKRGSRSPTQSASLGSTPDGDATVAFRFGPRTTALTSRTARPKKQRDFLKTAERKREMPVQRIDEPDAQS